MPWPGGGDQGGREGEGNLHSGTTQLEASVRHAHGSASPFVPASFKGECARPVSAASARLTAASEGQLAR
jgi:hypothetical protein